MIKALGMVHDGKPRPALFACLTREITDRLVAGDPIVFEMADLGLPPMRVVILFREDEAAVITYLDPIMRPDARVWPETPGAVREQAVDWRSIAAELAAAAGLMAVRKPDAGPEPRLAPALRAYMAAREREGL